MQEKTVNRESGPSAVSWTALVIAFISWISGCNFLFFIPVATAILGIVAMRKPGGEHNKWWRIYVTISIALALAMIISLLFLDPLGGVNKISDTGTEWEPAS